MNQCHPLVTGRRRPGRDPDAEPRVHQVAQDLPRHRVEHPEPEVQHVAVVAVPEAEQRAVGGEPARSGLPLPAQSKGTGRLVHQPPRPPRLTQVEPVRRTVGQCDGDGLTAPGQPLAPPRTQPGQQLMSLPGGQVRGHPGTVPVTAVVAPPRHSSAVGRHHELLDTDPLLSDRTPVTCTEVSRPDLGRSALVAHEDQTVRVRRRPRGEVDGGVAVTVTPVRGSVAHTGHATGTAE